jgi:hypothetical protein
MRYVTLSVSTNPNRPKFGTCITKGKLCLCFENARLEYWAQKAKGNDCKYIVGLVYGVPKEFEKEKQDSKPSGLSHAWVELEDNTIVDPTPYAIGKWVQSREIENNTAPKEYALKYWSKKHPLEYKINKEIKESKLRAVLKYFPL